jgi:hypothetical protein
MFKKQDLLRKKIISENPGVQNINRNDSLLNVNHSISFGKKPKRSILSFQRPRTLIKALSDKALS